MQVPKPTKYNAKKANLDGRSFDSQAEASLYGQLKIDESQGLIRDIRCQVQVELTEARVIYKPDFLVFDIALGVDVYCEFKGVETAEWRIKRRLWKYGYGPGRLRVYKGSAKRVFLFEEIVPRFPQGVY